MWRFLLLLTLAQFVAAGTIEIQVCSYYIEKGEISKSGRLTSTWGPSDKNKVVFEMSKTEHGGISLSEDSGGYMFHKLQALTQTELVPFPGPVYTKQLIFVIDSGDEPITSDRIIFRFEERILVDSSKHLYEINHFAMNKQELHKNYGITRGGLDLNTVDPKGDAKFIYAQDDSMVFYWNFYFYEEKEPESSEIDHVYRDTRSNISAPFVYAVQYQDYDKTLTFDRIAQDKTFEIPIISGKLRSQTKEIGRTFQNDLICILLPQNYDGNTLKVELVVSNRLRISSAQGMETTRYAAHVKELEFLPDDVIQVKLPVEWPGEIYETEKGFSIGRKDEGKLVFNPDIGDQYITIRPIKIQ